MKKILIFVVFVLSSHCWAQTFDLSTCNRLSSDVCIDSTPCKTFNGITTCLTGQPAVPGAIVLPQTCWQFEANYQCEDPSFQNYCAPLAAEPACAQVGVDECSVFSPAGACLAFQATYRCTSDMGANPGVATLDSGHSITRDLLDESQCSALRTSPVCELTSSTCTDTADRVIDGVT